MNTQNWSAFTLGELFDIYTGKDLIYSSLTYGEYPVIGHKAENNGITAYTKELDGYTLYDNTSTISLGDRGNFFAAVQSRPFYIGTRVKALTAKFRSNTHILLFIATLINKESFRFSYGRNSCDRTDNITIKLPSINIKGKLFPDLDYIEKLHSAITRNDCDISVATIIRKREHSQKYRVHYTEEKIYTSFEEKIKACNIPTCCYVWNKLYKKELIKNNYFTVGRYFEDVLWIPEIIKKSNKLSQSLLLCYG